MLTRKMVPRGSMGPALMRRFTSSFAFNVDSGLRPAKILCVSGSCRKGSFNQKLLKCAAQMAVDREAADVTVIDMRDFHLPIFCEDITNDQISDSAKELKKLFMETDGFIFTCPEYNGTMTPLLNNLCAWMSRPFSKDEPMYAAFKGKFAMIAATSPGALGGLRGLTPMAQMLTYVGVHVIANQVGVGGSYHAFDENGELVSDKTRNLLQDAVAELVTLSTDKANRSAPPYAAVARGLHAQYGHIELHHSHPTSVDDFDIHN